MCLYALLADVASKEQQQSAKDSSRGQEEEMEDTFMDTEEEELQAADAEQLKPEEIKSGTTVSPGGSYGEQIPPTFAYSSHFRVVPSDLVVLSTSWPIV